MGVDTRFFETQILLDASKTIKDVAKKVMRRYRRNKSIATDATFEFFSPGWKLDVDADIEDGDDTYLNMVDNTSGGDSRDFVADFLLILEATTHYGLTGSGVIPYSTVSSGMGASGVIWFDSDKVTITEIESHEITRQWKFSTSDYTSVLAGKFQVLADEKEKTIN